MEIRNTPIGMFSAAEEKTLMKTLAAATGQQANQFSLRDLQYLPIKNVSKNNISLPIHTFTKRIHVYKSHIYNKPSPPLAPLITQTWIHR
jgi:hypothetical protein